MTRLTNALLLQSWHIDLNTTTVDIFESTRDFRLRKRISQLLGKVQRPHSPTTTASQKSIILNFSPELLFTILPRISTAG